MSAPERIVVPLAPTPEAWVDRRALARSMGVSERTIARWVRDGAPSETWGLRARRFRVSEVAAWAKSRRMAA